ncbi:cyanovirin-n family protein [Coleophoma cylindrospora]|uniref:Cyanovirin-n family protein n=1 Tax=Coleophoma cylindrospora TaxID=1849047 RepID=A0A3D8RAA2_9HELO|nr:cyanovirin-n family protein [Coleophoma cylindrospora]
MSFHLSAEDIRIDDGHVLRARLRNEGGELVDTEIDLDRYIGNSDGRFEWEGQGFSQSAENVEFSIEGGGEVPVLRANLRNVEGEIIPCDVNLSERIENHNGQFVFGKHFVQAVEKMGLMNILFSLRA